MLTSSLTIKTKEVKSKKEGDKDRQIDRYRYYRYKHRCHDKLIKAKLKWLC